MHDRVRFNNSNWADMLTASINKYNNTKHSSTGLTPNQAHKDDNQLKVAVSLVSKERN